jgi:NAD-dependent SIR2 family protein deacetylase
VINVDMPFLNHSLSRQLPIACFVGNKGVLNHTLSSAAGVSRTFIGASREHRNQVLSNVRYHSNTLQKSANDLSTLIANRQKVVFVCGPKLSLQYGVPIFRPSKMGTKGQFRRDPLQWYNKKWLPMQAQSMSMEPTSATSATDPSVTAAAASDAYVSLAQFAQHFDCKIISENVDEHQQAALRNVGFSDKQIDDHFVAVHGTRSAYRCSDIKAMTSDMLSLHNCPYATHEVVPGNEVSLKFADAERTQLLEPPLCPVDQKPLMPAVLFANESHSEHSVFRWDRAVHWANFADVLVFVTPSRSAAVEMMLRIGWRNSLMMYEINAVPPTGLALTSGVEPISADDINRTLSALLHKAARRERFFAAQRLIKHQQQQQQQRQQHHQEQTQQQQQKSSNAIPPIPDEPRRLSLPEFLFRWIRMVLLDFVWMTNQYLLYALFAATGLVYVTRYLHSALLHFMI